MFGRKRIASLEREVKYQSSRADDHAMAYAKVMQSQCTALTKLEQTEKLLHEANLDIAGKTNQIEHLEQMCKEYQDTLTERNQVGNCPQCGAPVYEGPKCDISVFSIADMQYHSLRKTLYSCDCKYKADERLDAEANGVKKAAYRRAMNQRTAKKGKK